MDELNTMLFDLFPILLGGYIGLRIHNWQNERRIRRIEKDFQLLSAPHPTVKGEKIIAVRIIKGKVCFEKEE